MKELLRFAAMGVEDLTRLALAGRLTGPLVWVALEGGQRYLAAILRGDIAPRAERAARAKQCNRCPMRVDKPYLSVGVIGGSCGELDSADPARGTCGCRVTVTVRGRPHAAGKTWIASEACGAGVWGACAPAGAGGR